MFRKNKYMKFKGKMDNYHFYASIKIVFFGYNKPKRRCK